VSAGKAAPEVTLARLRAYAERRLTANEVRALLSVPISEEERENVLSLVRWFRRRYPTPAERLAYVRRAYARWQRNRST
jgi:site-specific recombinase